MDPLAIIVEHPQWAHRTTVTLICGPPGAGKNTLAAELHPHRLDMDDIPPGSPRERMRQYGLAAHKAGRNPTPHLAVIRGAPTLAQRQHLEGLCKPHRTIILPVDPPTCHQRIDARARPGVDGRDTEGQHAGVDQWWQAWSAEHEQHTEQW